MRNFSAGSALLSVVPWLVAAGGFLFGLMVWLTPPAKAPRDSWPHGDVGELQSIRLRLEVTNGENQALRRELDRLLEGGRARAEQATGGTRSSGPAPAGDEPPPVDESQLRELRLIS